MGQKRGRYVAVERGYLNVGSRTDAVELRRNNHHSTHAHLLASVTHAINAHWQLLQYWRMTINSPNALTIQRPALSLLLSEPFRAATEFAWHRLGKTHDAKPGDGHPVVIFPGLGADGKSVATLRSYCLALGYEAFDWGRGLNTGPQGDLDVWLDALQSQVGDLLAGHTQPATLIGWSLGGFYARELAKLMGPSIRQVITMGTPFNSDADHTNVGWLFRLLNGSSSTIDPALSLRLRTPPPIRTTSIYSREDGVVAWETCCHVKRSKLVHDIEVSGSHLGMNWNRDVLAVIADRLAQQPGPWRQYVCRH